MLLRQNDRNLEVKNGQLGSLLGIDHLRKQLVVGLDNQQTVVFSHEEYDKVSLGYATTVHKAQGMTVENAYVMTGGGPWDKHAAYVASSRAKAMTKVYAEGNENKRDTVKEKLAERMAKDNQKQLASDRMPGLRRSREPLRVGQEVGLSNPSSNGLSR